MVPYKKSVHNGSVNRYSYIKCAIWQDNDCTWLYHWSAFSCAHKSGDSQRNNEGQIETWTGHSGYWVIEHLYLFENTIARALLFDGPFGMKVLGR